MFDAYLTVSSKLIREKPLKTADIRRLDKFLAGRIAHSAFPRFQLAELCAETNLTSAEAKPLLEFFQTAETIFEELWPECSNCNIPFSPNDARCPRCESDQKSGESVTYYVLQIDAVEAIAIKSRFTENSGPELISSVQTVIIQNMASGAKYEFNSTNQQVQVVEGGGSGGQMNMIAEEAAHVTKLELDELLGAFEASRAALQSTPEGDLRTKAEVALNKAEEAAKEPNPLWSSVKTAVSAGGEILQKILVNIASESIKKILFPG